MKRLEKPEKLQVIQAIPYKSFKEKIDITRKYKGKGYIEVLEDLVYIENKEYSV